MTRVRTHRDARAFLSAIAPLVGDEEARHNLILGIVGTIVTHPDRYPEYHLWTVDEGGVVVGAAMMTPPHPLGIARPRDHPVLEALVAHLRTQGIPVPGVAGAEPEAAWFADLWTSASGSRAHVERREGIYRLRSVADVPHPEGKARPVREADRDRVTAWMDAFVAEALPPDPGARATARRSIEHRLDTTADAGLWVWDVDGDPVAMAGYSGPTPNGVRVGPVFTPREHRGRGYATGLVADMSQSLLEGGRSFCFLYADLANPTSNAIYRRIGYEHVCDARSVGFVDALES